ncbi:MAG: hypothetical protein VYA54_04130 [Bdellovibrionota bacterium]|nr:hypothetical protein [Bdellovibrionota bacterium]
MRFISKIVSLFLVVNVWALPELKTKQSVKNIRYISQDGKVTYYQKNSGQLQYSTNYDFISVMEKPKNTIYELTVSEGLKKVAIEVIDNPFAKGQWKSDNEIYLVDYISKQKPKLIGRGTSPKLHEKYNVLSYFSTEKNSIMIRRGDFEQEIKLVNKSNPFFIPMIEVLSPNEIVFTDINKEGFQAILLYSLADKTFEVLYKVKAPGLNIEICKTDEFLIAGTFPNSSYFSGSKILMTPLFRGSMTKSWKTIYENNFPDVGNMVCKNNYAFFLHTNIFKGDLNERETSVHKIKLDYDNEVSSQKIVEFEDASQIFKLGNMIITSKFGKYYIVEGSSPVEADAL